MLPRLLERGESGHQRAFVGVLEQLEEGFGEYALPLLCADHATDNAHGLGSRHADGGFSVEEQTLQRAEQVRVFALFLELCAATLMEYRDILSDSALEHLANAICNSIILRKFLSL